ncbi:PilZ domain-containing protein [Teredinibacter turnerae]|uniref:Type IV pilus assembly protein PilZ n=1 Tax=Teredinibacter turnerae (strain ATCC 39867 / T7901) TaxID=377629 RepID=C5BR04_TERTT|nr:PilZ domain-containing protein [Teredinibacter turnerae]ACR12703.1 type IV pilus assembly protein PilZ [Teredinibacter turnerae T7901]
MSLANREYQEKRNFIRMRVDTPIQMVLEADGERFEGKCRDLSGGGLLVELATALPVGTRARISIQSSHGHSPMLEAIALVNRVETQLDTTEKPCLIGMEIEELIR